MMSQQENGVHYLEFQWKAKPQAVMVQLPPPPMTKSASPD